MGKVEMLIAVGLAMMAMTTTASAVIVQWGPDGQNTGDLKGYNNDSCFIAGHTADGGESRFDHIGNNGI